MERRKTGASSRRLRERNDQNEAVHAAKDVTGTLTINQPIETAIERNGIAHQIPPLKAKKIMISINVERY